MVPWSLLPLPLLLSLLLPIILFLFFFFFFFFRTTTKRAALPPGPRPWPIIGNLPHLLLRLLSSKLRLHAALAAIANDYGPLFYLRLGFWNIVVASSPSSASHVLKTCDRFLCSRHIPSAYRTQERVGDSFFWNLDCDEYWRSLRSLMKAHLLSIPSLSKHAPVIEQKAMEMAQFLLSRSGDEVKIGEAVFTTVFNIIGNLVFSRDVLSLEGQGWFPDMKKHMERMAELGIHPSIEDLFPGLVMGFDVQGLRREVNTSE